MSLRHPVHVFQVKIVPAYGSRILTEVSFFFQRSIEHRALFSNRSIGDLYEIGLVLKKRYTPN